MKRLLCMLLALVMVLAAFSGCGQQEPQETTEAPAPTQSPEEADVLKIIVIGNSHGNDAMWLMKEVFKDQMPEQEVVICSLYYSGCSVTRHVQHATQNQAVYDLNINFNGVWETTEETTLETALYNQAWDIVVFQGGRGDTDDEYNIKNRRILEQYVNERVKQPYTMMWHITWPSPEEPTFYDPSYRVQPPSGWVDYLVTNYDHDLYKQFTAMTERATQYLVTDATYEKVICSGAGIMNAHAVSGVPQLDLWRDYTHLSDYGRLIAAYSFYAQLTGKEITEINLEKIPASLRQKYFRDLGDLVITEEMKQVIIAAANASLEDPWAVPARP